MPRILPPYVHGLFVTTPQAGWETTRHAGTDQQSNPTLVNNAETLSNVPHILAQGADWFRSIGTAGSAATVVATVVGDVIRPAVGEVALGTSLRSVIDDIGGGPAPGRRVKAVLPGVANAVITEADLDVALEHAAFEAIGSGLGAAGFIVVDDTACMVEVARLVSRFLFVESCGQCPPCKLGSEQITRLLVQIEGGNATKSHLDELRDWLRKVTDGNRCFLAVEEQRVIASILDCFGDDEVVEHIEAGRCPGPRPVAFPKLVDLHDGVAVYDQDYERKRPDWTYATEQ